MAKSKNSENITLKRSMRSKPGNNVLLTNTLAASTKNPAIVIDDEDENENVNEYDYDDEELHHQSETSQNDEDYDEESYVYNTSLLNESISEIENEIQSVKNKKSRVTKAKKSSKNTAENKLLLFEQMEAIKQVVTLRCYGCVRCC